MMLKHMAALSNRENRYKHAVKLAEYLGCSYLLILIRDPEIDTLLPAPGFPQTLPLNKQWIDFLSATKNSSFYQDNLPYPNSSTQMWATGIAAPDGSVAILLGGTPAKDELEQLTDLLPMLTALFIQEQQSLVAETNASVSEKAVTKAEKLANTIDAMRIKLKDALFKQEKDKQAIEDLLKKKDEFINTASHELKTPVTSLKASLQLLNRMKENPSPKLFPYLILQCNKSMDKISNLIDAMLSSSYMNEGQLKLDKRNFTIAPLLKDYHNYLQTNGGFELIFQGDQELQIYADEHRIDQVVVNFLTNAVKYAAGSKKIYLILEKEDNMIKLSVKDNGPGVAPDKVPYLFDRYYRVDHSGFEYSGLGLGLYISAEIIKRHGGTIGASSELGNGSTFWFKLPLNPGFS